MKLTIVKLRLDAPDGEQNHQNPVQDSCPLDIANVTVVSRHDDLKLIHVPSRVHAQALLTIYIEQGKSLSREQETGLSLELKSKNTGILTLSKM